MFNPNVIRDSMRNFCNQIQPYSHFFSEMKHCKPIVILSLFPQKMFRQAKFLSSTSSNLYSQELSCHICRVESSSFPSYSTGKQEVPLSFFLRITALWNMCLRDVIYSHNLHLIPPCVSRQPPHSVTHYLQWPLGLILGEHLVKKI